MPAGTPRRSAFLPSFTALLAFAAFAVARTSITDSGDSSYIGCFSEPRAFWSSFASAASGGVLSRLGCSNACKGEGAPTFGLSNSTCACGADLPDDLQAVRNASCSTPCHDFSIEACGSLSYIYAVHWSNFSGVGPVTASALVSATSAPAMSEPSKIWIIGVVVPPVFLALGALGGWLWYRKMKSLLSRGDVEGFRATRYEGTTRAIAQGVNMEELERLDDRDAELSGPRAVPFDEEAELSGSSAGTGTTPTRSSTSLPPSHNPSFLATAGHRPLRPKPSKVSFRSPPLTAFGEGGQRLLSKKRRPGSRGSHSLVSGEDPDAAPPPLKPQRTRKVVKSFGTGEEFEVTDGSENSDGAGVRKRPWLSDAGHAASGPSAAYFANLASSSASHPSFPDTSPYASFRPTSTVKEGRRLSRTLLVGKRQSAKLSADGSSTGSSNSTSIARTFETAAEQSKSELLPPIVTTGSALSLESALDFNPSAEDEAPTQHTFGVPNITSSSAKSSSQTNYSSLAFNSAISPESPTSPVESHRDSNLPPAQTFSGDYSSADIYSNTFSTMRSLEGFRSPSPSGTHGTFGARVGAADPTRPSNEEDERRPLVGPREYEGGVSALSNRNSHPYVRGFAWMHGAIDSRGSLPSAHHEQRRLTLTNPDSRTTSISDAARGTSEVSVSPVEHATEE